MQDFDFEMPSGAKLHVTPTSFQDAKALTKALMRSNIGVQVATNPMDMDITVLKDAILKAATSDEVEALVFKCLERATWNDQRVTPKLFDDPASAEQARADFFMIVWRTVEVNCKPFFVQALSVLKGYLPKNGSSPASK